MAAEQGIYSWTDMTTAKKRSEMIKIIESPDAADHGALKVQWKRGEWDEWTRPHGSVTQLLGFNGARSDTDYKGGSSTRARTTTR